MKWTEKYWDAVEQIYWTPKYLWLDSINKSNWSEDGDRISVPADMVNKSGGLYRRVKRDGNYRAYAQCQEEFLNHLFELTVGILDGVVISELLLPLCYVEQRVDLESHGRALGDALDYPKLYDIFQPDGFFFADGLCLALELKFVSPTSLDQLGKYLLGFALHRLKYGPGADYHLLFVTPNSGKLMSALAPVEEGRLSPAMFDLLVENSKSRSEKMLTQHRETVRSVMDATTVHSRTWSDLVASMEAKKHSLSHDDTAHRTVARLLDGMIDEITANSTCGVARREQP